MSDNSKEMELNDALVNAIRVVMRYSALVDGVINSVDETNYVCDVTVGDSVSSIVYNNVPLRVLTGSAASVIEIPVTGSNCIICFRDANLGRPQLLMVDQTLKLLVNCNNVIFNQGQLGGMVKVMDLVTRLNNIEQDINNLKTAFSGWVTVPEDGGAALKSITATWYGEQLQETRKSDIENTKITQ